MLDIQSQTVEGLHPCEGMTVQCCNCRSYASQGSGHFESKASLRLALQGEYGCQAVS